MPADRPARDDGETPTTGASVPRMASRTPGTPRTMPMLDHRVARRQQHDVGLPDRFQHTGSGDRVVHAGGHDLLRRGRPRACAPTTPGSGRPGVPRPSSTTTWVSTGSSVIGSSVTLWSARPQRAHSISVTADNGMPSPSSCAAGDVRRDVPVAEAEPLRLRAVRGQLALDHERLVVATPALRLVDPAAERVHQRVQVGAHPQTEERDVVAGVADDRDLRIAAVRIGGSARCVTRPRRNRAPPTPPARAVMRMEKSLSVPPRSPRRRSVRGMFPQISLTGLTWRDDTRVIPRMSRSVQGGSLRASRVEEGSCTS